MVPKSGSDVGRRRPASVSSAHPVSPVSPGSAVDPASFQAGPDSHSKHWFPSTEMPGLVHPTGFVLYYI